MQINRRAFAAGILAALTPPIIARTRPVRAHSAHGSPADLTILVGEFYFRAPGEAENAPMKLESGRPHLIRFVNEGFLDHEVHFGRNPDVAMSIYRDNLFAPQAPGQRGPHHSHGFLGLHLPPWDGETMPQPFGELHVWIPRGLEGEWEIGCFVPSHYEAGQHAPLMIVAPDGAA